MNQEIYTKNMEALREKYPAWALKIENIKRKKRGFDVLCEQSLMGDPILKVCQNGRTLYLNGKYAPGAVVERWLSKQGKFEEYTPIAIVGISNGIHIKRIFEEAPKTANFLVYEPSLEIFRRALEEVDLTFLFAPDIPVGIIVDGMNEDELEPMFSYLISYDNMMSLKWFVSGNYDVLFPEQVEKFVTLLKEHVSNIHIQWNTFVRYTDVKARNTFQNLHYLYEGYSVSELANILPADVPTIVVAAGPSLNKNILDLKKAVGKACIIATDTAMKPLLNAGIVPNLFVIVDGLKPGLLFQHKDISKVPMVTMTAVSIEAMDSHNGKKFFYYTDNGFENHILKEYSEKAKANKMLPNLVSGGSVATSAYSLGIYMGSRTVILIGQDLALTGNKTHADGTFKDKMDEVDVEHGGYIEVESIDGGKVYTRGDLLHYLQWYEKYIEKWKHVTTVDATEGGALIHGSKIMTLKKAIQKYCKREFNVKWHIDHAKKLFPEEYKQIAHDNFLHAEQDLLNVEKKAKEGLRYYGQLEKLSKKQTASDAEIRKTYKKIRKINKYMESNYMAITATDSLSGLDFVLRPTIYQVKEDRASEFQDVAAQGKVMLESIAIAAKELSGVAKDTVVKYAEEHPIVTEQS